MILPRLGGTPTTASRRDMHSYNHAFYRTCFFCGQLSDCTEHPDIPNVYFCVVPRMCNWRATKHTVEEDYPPRTIDPQDIATCHRCQVQVHIDNTRMENDVRICAETSDCDLRVRTRQ